MTPLDYELLSLIAAVVNIAGAIWNVRQGLRARRNAAGGTASRPPNADAPR